VARFVLVHRMSFRLFGIPVEVQISFWITSVLLGLYGQSDPFVPRGAAVVIWVAVVFVSVLLHELGHAFAMMRHGILPEITLYAMGGLTHNRSNVSLRRRDQVIISLAGPFAGFLLGGLVVAAMLLWPGFVGGLSPIAVYALRSLCWVNLFWGVINLMPVLPLDGGHVLEQTLGPRHTQLTAGISTVVGFLVAAGFVYVKSVWGAVMFGYMAFQSYRRFTSEAAADGERPARPARSSKPDPEAVPAEIDALLRSAEHALAEEELDRAAAIAQRVLEGEGGPSHRAFDQASDPPTGADAVPPAARRRALEVIGWSHLLAGRLDVAAEVIATARRTGSALDAALEGAVLFAQRDFAKARKVLEAAHAAGDARKQVVGPLIQILIAQDEVGRAAEIALSMVDALSDEDARQMGELAFTHGAFAGAARLYEAIFERRRQADDAYQAARAEARGGRPERALDLLRRAVDAGFSDRARAWSDAALATLRTGPSTAVDAAAGSASLETVLPRP
jgi:Zn-dependent protease/tetratricopeptide (TPR) repeat protein